MAVVINQAPGWAAALSGFLGGFYKSDQDRIANNQRDFALAIQAQQEASLNQARLAAAQEAHARTSIMQRELGMAEEDRKMAREQQATDAQAWIDQLENTSRFVGGVLDGDTGPESPIAAQLQPALEALKRQLPGMSPKAAEAAVNAFQASAQGMVLSESAMHAARKIDQGVEGGWIKPEDQMKLTGGMGDFIRAVTAGQVPPASAIDPGEMETFLAAKKSQFDTEQRELVFNDEMFQVMQRHLAGEFAGADPSQVATQESREEAYKFLQDIMGDEKLRGTAKRNVAMGRFKSILYREPKVDAAKGGIVDLKALRGNDYSQANPAARAMLELEAQQQVTKMLGVDGVQKLMSEPTLVDDEGNTIPGSSGPDRLKRAIQDQMSLIATALGGKNIPSDWGAMTPTNGQSQAPGGKPIGDLPPEQQDALAQELAQNWIFPSKSNDEITGKFGVDPGLVPPPDFVKKLEQLVRDLGSAAKGRIDKRWPGGLLNQELLKGGGEGGPAESVLAPPPRRR